MNKEYCQTDWWVKQIEGECEKRKKKSEKYRKSNRRFKMLLLFSFIVLAFGIAIGMFADLQTTTITKSIGESLETLLMFIAGILAGFTIDEYRNRATILENASLLRPIVFKEMIKNMERKGKLQAPKVQKCLFHIQNGAAQMSKSGDEGLSVLKDVINNVIKEICK
jgi:hypothetical protein